MWLTSHSLLMHSKQFMAVAACRRQLTINFSKRLSIVAGFFRRFFINILFNHLFHDKCSLETIFGFTNGHTKFYTLSKCYVLSTHTYKLMHARYNFSFISFHRKRETVSLEKQKKKISNNRLYFSNWPFKVQFQWNYLVH